MFLKIYLILMVLTPSIHFQITEVYLYCKLEPKSSKIDSFSPMQQNFFTNLKILEYKLES